MSALPPNADIKPGLGPGEDPQACHCRPETGIRKQRTRVPNGAVGAVIFAARRL